MRANRRAPPRPRERTIGIRAFLIADIRGYTRFTQEFGDEAAARLATKFADLAHEGVEAWGGQIIETRGDEALGVFDSTRGAIRAAVELQSAFADETAADPSLPLQVGIGLDAGEAVPVADGYRGGALNLAARLCAQAGPGEILASREAAHLARKVEGISYQRVADRALKGLDGAIQLVRVVSVAEEPAGMVRAPSEEALATRSEFPPELDSATPLVGRDLELRWLRWAWRRARHGHGRAVFLTGRSGIGKTRLAAEMAREAHAEGGEVLYARCAGPAQAALDVLQRARVASVPALLIADDLDVAGGTVLSFAGRLVSPLKGRPVLMVGTLRSDRARTVASLLDRAGPSADVVRRLPPLDAEGVHEIVALHAGRSAARVDIEEFLEETGGVPAMVHRLAGEWVSEQASTKVGTSAKRAASGRRDLRSAEARVARDVIGLQVARERARRYGVEPADEQGEEPAPTTVCPFKGLATFDADDADYFFGRERLVAEMVARLVGTSFLGVVGPSGSGKSSAVRAGLMPGLAAGVLPSSDRWALTSMRPGERPLAELDRILDALPLAKRRSPKAQDDSIARALRSLGTRRLVLLVDQFEEVFTTCRDRQERDVFVDALVRLARDGEDRVTVVVAVRADYYGPCATYADLADLLGANHVLVGPMAKDELRRAIELPARRVGLQVEPELTDALVAEVVDEPGGLPLLSTTLLELWQRRADRTLTIASFRESGGVRGAVGRLAEDAYGRLSPDQQVIARAILLRLAGPGEGDAAVRRRVPLTEFDVERSDDTARVLEVLTEARLLTASEGSTEVAHEALLREWPRLRGWLEEDAQGRHLRVHLARTARDWEERGGDAADLYRGARLASAMDWSAAHDIELNELERRFLRESRAGSEREAERQRRINRRLRASLVGVGILLAVALVAGSLAIVQRNRAERSGRETRARELALAADANLSVDPELSVLLALEAVETTREADGRVLKEAEQALHRAVGAQRIIASIPEIGGADYLADGERLIGFAPAGNSLDPEIASEEESARTAWIVDATTGKKLLTLKGHKEPITDVAVSPSASLVATSSLDGTTIVWDPDTGAELETLRDAGEAAAVRVAFSPDGRLLATGAGRKGDGVLTVWDTSRWQPVATLGPHVGGVKALTWAPDSSRIAVTPYVEETSTSAWVAFKAWNVRTGRRLYTAMQPTSYFGIVADPHWTDAIRWTADGLSIMSVSGAGTVDVWDAKTGLRQGSTLAHRAALSAQGLAPDGSTLATGGRDGGVIVWQMTPDGPRRLLDLSTDVGTIRRVSFSPDGTRLAVGSEDEVTKIWDVSVAGGSEGLSLTTTDYVPDVAFSPDGTRFAISGSDKTVAVYDPSTGDEVDSIDVEPERVGDPHFVGAYDIDYSPDGDRLAFAYGDSGFVWDLDSDAPPIRLGPVLGVTSGIDFSPDGRLVVTSNYDLRTVDPEAATHTVQVWDARTGEQLWQGPSHGAILPQLGPGGLLSTGGQDGTVRLLDARTGKLLKILIDVKARTAATAFSPDGRLLAAGLLDGTARIWDIATGDEVHTLNGGNTYGVAFSPDGRRLATGHTTSDVRIWDVDSGRELLTLSGHRHEVWSLAFAPDGSRLASAAFDRTVRIWLLDVDGLMNVARDRLTRTFTQQECAQYRIESCPAGGP